jgi:hypothetical protein
MGEIRQATAKDLIAIKKMTDEYIGVDFYTMSYLEKIYNTDDNFIYVYTNDEDEAVAYLYFFISTLQEALEVIHASKEYSRFDDMETDSKVCVYKTTCTDKAYRNRGLLTSFLQKIETVIKDNNNVKCILAPALRTPAGVIPVENVVLAAGFKKRTEIMHPWSHIDSYCPYCKNRNCQCDSVIYTKEMT